MEETKVKRNRRTPAERAQAELETAQSVVKRLEAKADKLADEMYDVKNELRAAKDRLSYAQQNPALQPQEYSVIDSDDADGDIEGYDGP